MVGAGVAFGLGGCASEAYDRADLQLDVDAPLPVASATLHLCASASDGSAGFGELDLGAGNGRAAFTGLLAGAELQVTVQALDADGLVLGSARGLLGGDDVRYVLAPWSETDTTLCRDRGQRAPADAETWLLGVRFAEPSWS